MNLQPSFLMFEAASCSALAGGVGVAIGMRRLHGTVSRFRGALHAPPDH